MTLNLFSHLTKTVHKAVYPAIDPSRPALSAAGKTIIISGGASGIGYLTAEAFSIARAARIVIISRRQEALDEAFEKLNAKNAATGLSTEIWTYRLDITDKSTTEDVFNAIRTRLNENRKDGEETIDADILITSAAHFAVGPGSLEMDPEGFNKSFQTNVSGNLNLVRAFLAPDLPSIPFAFMDGKPKDISSAPPIKNKTILDVGSSASYLLFPGQSPYSTSKLAFTHLMRILHSELKAIEGQPIRIHSYNPGLILHENRKASLDKNFMNSFAWDDESLPGPFAVWLASPEAEFLAGRFVMSAWDVDELKALKPKYEADPKFGTINLVQ